MRAEKFIFFVLLCLCACQPQCESERENSRKITTWNAKNFRRIFEAIDKNFIKTITFEFKIYSTLKKWSDFELDLKQFFKNNFH